MIATPDSGVAVVIATCDRGDAIVRTLRSILANAVRAADIRVVDQSRDERTRNAVRPFAEAGACEYMHTPLRGLSRAHNLAIASIDASLIALTDDDCEVAPDWLERIAAGFEDPEIGVIFGNARPADHDPRAGLVTGYERDDRFVARSLRDKIAIDGLGACMAFRREVWERAGGFDESLGAGARFRAANDGDLAVRALRCGYAVAEVPEVAVVHYGYRPWPEARTLLCGYSFGTGAMLAKHLKAGTPHVPRLLAQLGLRWLRGRRHPPARLGGNRYPVARLLAFVRGGLGGLLTPVDPETLRFKAGAPGGGEAAGAANGNGRPA